MHRIIVVKREGKKVNEDAEWLDINDIIGIFSEVKSGKSSVIFRTKDAEYIGPYGIEMIMKLFENLEEEYKFIRADRGVMVNLKKIEAMDEKNKLLYYNNKEDSFTVAGTRWKQVKESFLKIKNSGCGNF